MHNYQELYKDPTEEQVELGLTTQRQLEITELTNSESFGEDHGALAKGFQN